MRPILLLAAVPLLAQDFAQVHSILTARCTGCHSAQLPQGGLNLSGYAGARRMVTPRDPAASLLMQRVTGAKGPRMPLGAAPLSDAETAVIRQWIEAGAPEPKGASISTWRPSLRLTAPELPASAEAHPVDKLLGAYFAKRSIRPAGAVPGAAVNDAMFARRAYYDLHGLPPTPAQLDAFERDASADKHAALVARLLADKDNYTAHWISFWNDLLRNDEGVVYHGDRKSITPWLKQALRDNLTYDKFLRALLNPAEKGAPEGYLLGVNWRGDVSASQIPVIQAAQNSAQVFLGVNLKCNSCHDSFISQWKLKDAYGLAAFFSDGPLAIHRCEIPTGETAAAKFLYPELGGVDAGAPLAIKRAAAADLFTKPENGRMPRTLVNRVWKQLMGRGLVEPVDDMDAEPWSPELLDWLAADFVAHGYDIKHLLALIMSSRAYRMRADASEPAAPYLFRGPLPRRLSAEQFADTVSAITGEWRLMEPRAGGMATYARDWQVKSTALGRALGRPIRDQVFTQRQTQPTTLDALELVNGATLSKALRRGALRLTGQLRATRPPLFDSGVSGQQKVAADIDVSGREKLWLMVMDAGSYDATRVQGGWADAVLSGPQGDVPLAEVARRQPEPWKFKGDKDPSPFVAFKTPEIVALDIAGRGFTRFRAHTGVNEDCLQSDINPRVRFFVFGEEPDLDHLWPASGEPPVPLPAAIADRKQRVASLYRSMLARAPSASEQRAAAELASTVDGVEDLMWTLFLSPEFQYVR